MRYSKELDIRDEAKTDKQLLTELHELRKRVSELENGLRQKIPIEALPASDQKYRDIFDNAPVGIFRTTPDGRLLDANHELSRILGYQSPQELIDTTNRTSVPEALYIDPELRPNLVVNKALTNKGHWDKSKVRLRRSDDKIITVWLYFRAVSGEEPAVIEGFCEDISERLRAEDALRSSEMKYQIVADNTYDWEYWMSPEGRYLYSSPSSERITGYGAGEYEEDPELLFRIIHPDDRSKYEEHIGQTQLSSTSKECEFRIIHRDGTTRWIGHVYQQVFDESGQYLGRRGSNRDITDRKQGEAELQRAHQELEWRVEERTAELARANHELRNAHQALQDIIEFLPDATFVIDREKKVIAWNRAIQELTGVAKKDILGKGGYAAAFYGEERPIMIDLVMEEGSRAEDKRYTVLERKGKTIFGEAVVPVTFKEKPVYVWATATPLYNDKREIIGAIESVRDVTNLKRAEHQISKLNCVNQLLLGTGSLEQKLKSITDGAVEIFSADFARIWLIRRGDLCANGCCHTRAGDVPGFCRDHVRCLHLVASSGRYENIDGSHRRMPLGYRKVGGIASGYPKKYITNEVTQDPFVDHEWATRMGLIAFGGFQLVAPDGKPVGVLAMFRKEPIQLDEEKLLQNLADTSSQVIIAGLAEEALRESEAKFRTLFDQSPMGISITRRDVTLLQNEAALRMYGYDDCSQVVGTSPLSRFAPHRRDEMSEYIARRARGESVPGNYETEAIRRDGSIFHLSIQAAGIQWAGQPATVAFLRDITERKKTEEELIRYRNRLEALVGERTSELLMTNEQLSLLIDKYQKVAQDLKEREEFLDAIVENIPDMIFVKEAKDLRFVRVNRAAEELIGYSRKDLMGKTDYHFFPKDEADFFTGKDWEVLQSRGFADIQEETILTRDKGQRVLHTKKIPILDHEGNPEYLLGISQDVTEFRHAQVALRKSEETLRQSEINLRSLASQLFTIQETERNRISKELHDGLGQDLTVMKIYLNSIKTQLSANQKSLVNDCDFLLGRIDHSVEDMRRICHDLSPYLLEELGLEVALKHLFEDVCERNGLCCQLDLQDISQYFQRKELVTLYRIFQEALTNIVKHSEATQVSASIKEQDGRVNFSVADNGKGFDFREVSRRSSSERGMGIFAIEERANMLGGSFEIHSKAGNGTLISISVPLKKGTIL